MDIDAILHSTVAVRATIPEDAFTADSLGTLREGSGAGPFRSRSGVRAAPCPPAKPIRCLGTREHHEQQEQGDRPPTQTFKDVGHASHLCLPLGAVAAHARQFHRVLDMRVTVLRADTCRQGFH